ncbi:hypothetical protein [Lysobacter arvi]|uniref:Uncharacterized protein n=1 Tax=Lysobacter arvi TaxID=3038776 RepID=A0ABU1CD74_9GAMM|nr:hypothetical protein [Lysobacter arvi]MDR0183116.1 hypothetical protein [Lysobacter arvi]
MRYDAFDFLRSVLTTVALAWSVFAVMRWQRPLIARGQGWAWVALAGVLSAAQWAVNVALRNPISCPIAVALLVVIAMIGLAPDDSVLTSAATAQSLWFRRGVAAALLGTVGGMALWMAMQ